MKSDHSSLFRTHSDIQLLCIFNVKLESITFTSVEVKKNQNFHKSQAFFLSLLWNKNYHFNSADCTWHLSLE